MISIINSPYCYGKPPSLLRDSGSKNPIFSSKSAFLKKEKTWSHMISKILRCALFLSNQRFWGKKNSKKNSTSPSLKFAKNGRPEPLWSRRFSAQMLCALLLKAFTVVLPSKTAICHYIAFLKGNVREVVLSYMSSYGSVQSSILRRIWCSTLMEQRMQRPAAKSNENCEGKKCAPQGARSSKKNSILYTHSFQKRAAAAAAAATMPKRTSRSDFKF